MVLDPREIALQYLRTLLEGCSVTLMRRVLSRRGELQPNIRPLFQDLVQATVRTWFTIDVSVLVLVARTCRTCAFETTLEHRNRGAGFGLVLSGLGRCFC